MTHKSVISLSVFILTIKLQCTQCKKGVLKTSLLQAVGRSVWLMAAIHNIKLKFVHIAGSINQKADLLSRVVESVDKLKHVQNQFSNLTWWKVNGEMFYPNMLI